MAVVEPRETKGEDVAPSGQAEFFWLKDEEELLPRQARPLFAALIAPRCWINVIRLVAGQTQDDLIVCRRSFLNRWRKKLPFVSDGGRS